MGECTDQVNRLYSSGDLRVEFPDSDWDLISEEFDHIMVAFEQIGVRCIWGRQSIFRLALGVFITL